MEWKIEPFYDGKLIRDYLQEVQGFSKRIMKALKYDGGELLVNGNPETVTFKLSAGDTLSILFPPEQKGSYMKAEEIPVDIVYEDDGLLVLNKSAGMPVSPSYQHTSGTVANALLGYYEKMDIPYTIHIVTRLDRDTSGLMLVAKHRYSHSLLSVQQQTGAVKRKYKAILQGHLPEKNGIIDYPIGRKEGSIIERTVVEDGKHAITHYRITKEWIEHSLADVQLETGRTHQIRVHFSYMGYPLAGDDLYGGSKQWMNRQALHCDELSFVHPFTKKQMQFCAPLPADMQAMVHRTNQKS
ncbi:RluA family pseudouridine synthase [Virgibacillus sp. SK37]|uniref:RluA family pseudouridine synthase n=1 Tax=Virgibacillus sp. SK37 TaxID=403957 RepID=UPI0004D0FF7E|nr:RluA family pseudouridine synthase [Virgibacillus sp. SK37]AIF42788.1 RNA pseudouridine synthase [Virgibacillus sp. SK37]